jgi:Tfp pilus assembly protein PilN
VLGALALCAVAPWWWALHREAARLDGSLARARERTARLRLRATEADALSRTAALLQQRIEAVQQVQRTRGDRLRMLTAVSEALPEDCRLSTLADDGSGTVKIEGRALDVSSVLEFVHGIAASGVFPGGVDVVDSHTVTTAGAEDGDIVFVLRALLAEASARAARAAAGPQQATRGAPR